jgi:FixJ family two-component response regulator
VALVDDDRSVRDALRALLRSAGLNVEAFASAEEFLDSRHSSEFACLVLDVRMSGMSGLELQDLLLASESRISIVFMTAHPDPGMRAQVLGNGAVEFLQKPFSDDALLGAIAVSLERPRP